MGKWWRPLVENTHFTTFKMAASIQGNVTSQDVKTLIDKKDSIEAEIKELLDLLESVSIEDAPEMFKK